MNNNENIGTSVEKIENEITQEEYNKLKARLTVLEKRKTSRLGYVLFGFIGLVIGIFFQFCLVDTFSYELNFSSVILSIIFGTSIGAITACYYALSIEMQENALQSKMIVYEAEHIKEEIKEDIFENSIKMSYKYLDQYYLQTREQAQRGFFVTVCVAIFGAFLIGAGIISMFLQFTEPSYIASASGVITEFISAIFFSLYNKTISSMSKYHNKLVLSQNISIALKVADSLPTEDKVKTKNLIITELLKDINIHLVKNDSTS